MRPAWLDAPLPAPTVKPAASPDLVAAGIDFAHNWAAEATQDEYAALLSARPYLAPEFDAQLLRTASRGTWLSPDERRMLRDALWAALLATEPGRG